MWLLMEDCTANGVIGTAVVIVGKARSVIIEKQIDSLKSSYLQ